MGIISNAVKEMGYETGKITIGLGKEVTASGCAPGGYDPGAWNELVMGALCYLEAGSKQCPVITELRDVNEGIALGDFKKVAINVGVLVLALSPIGIKRKHIVAPCTTALHGTAIRATN